MYCPKCGCLISNEARFCKSCGHEMTPSQQNGEPGVIRKPRTKLIVAVVLSVIAIACAGCLIAFFAIPALTRQSSNSIDAPYGKTISNVAHNIDYIIDGQWIYSFNDAITASDAGAPAAIIRTKTDGSVSEVVYTPDETYSYSSFSDLYLINNRMYFVFNGFNIGDAKSSDACIMSVGINGDDPKRILELSGESTSMQIVHDRIFFTRNDSLYSMSFDGENRTRICDAGYNNWVIYNGYAYVTESKDSKYVIKRYSLNENESESLYSLYKGGIQNVTPKGNKLFFTESVDPDNTNSNAKQLVSLDIDTGDKQILFKEPYNGKTISNWSIEGESAYLCIISKDNPTSFYRVKLDGSQEDQIFVYDGSWAGNPMRSRILAGADDVFIYRFSAMTGSIYFEPYSSTVLSNVMQDDWQKPMYTPLCSVHTDGTGFKVLTLMDSTSVEPSHFESE